MWSWGSPHLNPGQQITSTTASASSVIEKRGAMAWERSEQGHRRRTGPGDDIQRRHRPHLLVGRPKSFAVSDWLGHASVAITGDVYGHTSDDTARAAVTGLAGRLGLLSWSVAGQGALGQE
jgi:hypothetical protein